MRWLAIAPLLLWACGPSVRDEAIGRQVTLSSIESCEALETYFEDSAVEVLQDAIDARLDDGFKSDPPDAVDIDAPQIVGGSPFERVVVDLDRVFVLDAGLLRAVGIAPLRELGTLAIEGRPLGIVPAGDRLFILTASDTQTIVTLVSRDDLAFVRSVHLAGQPLSAAIDGAGLALVLDGGITIPTELEVIEETRSLEGAEYRIQREAAIRFRSLDDWLAPDDLGRDCTSYSHAPGAPLHLGLTRLVRLDARDLEAHARTLIGASRTAVLGHGRITLIAEHRWRLPRPGQVQHGYLFAFDAATLEAVAFGGMDGLPASPDAVSTTADTIRVVAAIERRLSDPINTWGTVARDHQVQTLSLRDGELAPLRSSPTFAEDSALRAVRFVGERAIAATADRIYAFDLSLLDGGGAAFTTSGPIDRIASAGGTIIAAGMTADQLSISVLDPAALDRVLSARTIAAQLQSADLGLAIDPLSRRIAVPELGAALAGNTAPFAIAVRVLAIGPGGELSSLASIDLSLLYADRPSPPHLLYGLIAGPYALAVSDAGVAVLEDGELAGAQRLAFD